MQRARARRGLNLADSLSCTHTHAPRALIPHSPLSPLSTLSDPVEAYLADGACVLAWCAAALRRARGDLERAAGDRSLKAAGWAAADLSARLAGLVPVVAALAEGEDGDRCVCGRGEGRACVHGRRVAVLTRRGRGPFPQPQPSSRCLSPFQHAQPPGRRRCARRPARHRPAPAPGGGCAGLVRGGRPGRRLPVGVRGRVGVGCRAAEGAGWW